MEFNFILAYMSKLLFQMLKKSANIVFLKNKQKIKLEYFCTRYPK